MVSALPGHVVPFVPHVCNLLRVDLSEQVEDTLVTTTAKSTYLVRARSFRVTRLDAGGDELTIFFTVTALEKLHAKHVLPGFTDRTAEEREIESLTTDITKVYWANQPRFLACLLFQDIHITYRGRTFDTVRR